MRVLVTGVKGQLGSDIAAELKLRAEECIGADIADFDITDRGATVGTIKKYMPDCVIHCAAFTDVNGAEEKRGLCERINVLGTENVALACNEADAKLIYISTDYVFNGEGMRPYKPNDERNPINFYGMTKSLGEDKVRSICPKHFIVRTSWVFGKNGTNFVKTMLRLGEQMEGLTVVDDQIGSPTYTPDLARLLCDMAATERYGTYHATNEGFCSWYDFAKKIMELSGIGCNIKPIASKDYPSPAKRPQNSRLSKEKLVQNGFYKLPPWEDALKRFIKALR
ncbi:MAG: dTDP-4-dehydrorhamnose reductase [Clostridiales bacterium]|nr:dTDP-4-dehydrorhamnose reductase [Clostridiales bacterium]